MEKQTHSPAKQSLSPELRALALPPEDLRKLVLLLITLRLAQGDLRRSKLVLGPAYRQAGSLPWASMRAATIPS